MAISVYYDNASQQGGPYFLNGNLARGNDLLSLATISILTDRVAETGWQPSPGLEDRMGWWGDAYSTRPIGSRLWQLRRAILNDDTASLATTICQEALQWMVDDNLIGSFTVTSEVVLPDSLEITYQIFTPNQTSIGVGTIQDPWSGIDVALYNATIFDGTLTSTVAGNITGG